MDEGHTLGCVIRTCSSSNILCGSTVDCMGTKGGGRRLHELYAVGRKDTEMIKQPYIIAEAGVDHEGEMYRMEILINAAKAAGADAIKTQYYRPGLRGPNRSLPRLSEKEMYKAWEIAKGEGLTFLCTPHDEWALDFLEEWGVFDTYKIGSGTVCNKPLLYAAIDTNKDLIVSTGMHREDQVSYLMGALDPEKDAILHCVSEYPTPARNANIRYMHHLARMWGGRVGYSDHCEGFGPAVGAAVLGADIIEKHICVHEQVPDRQDTLCALNPTRFKTFVQTVRDACAATDQSVLHRELTEGEEKTLAWVRYRDDDEV